MYTIDIDIGGTFTDGFLTDGIIAYTAKVPTSSRDLSECVMGCLEQGTEQWGIPLRTLLQNTDVFRLSTTLGTNTILEKTGSRIGLIVSAGYEQSLYSETSTRSPALGVLVQPDMVLGIDGEIGPDNDELLPLKHAQIIEGVRDLINRGARLIGVSLRGAWRNPAHEIEIRRIVQDRYPAHYLRSILLQLGSEISASTDDHSRTTTLAANAYLHRQLARELYRIEDQVRLAGYLRPILIVHASGGSARVAKTVAVQTLHSGPAAAVHGAWALASLMGLDDAVTADVGGTSCDVGYVAKQSPVWDPMPVVEGLTLALPMIEVDSIAAGGGSIAKVGLDGAIEVGPESAGVSPGPACFGNGGEMPTLTDADLILGYLDPRHFVGGRMPLYPEMAQRVVRELAISIGQPLEHTAWHIRRVVTTKMGLRIEGGLRQKGLDPAKVTLFSAGGAGPPHGCATAEAAGIRRVVAFPFGSALSAFGSSSTDVKHSYSQTIATAFSDDLLMKKVEQAKNELSERALRDMRGEGFSPKTVSFDLNCLIVENGKRKLIPGSLLTSDVQNDAGSVKRYPRSESGNTSNVPFLESIWLTCTAPALHWYPEQESSSDLNGSPPVSVGNREVLWDYQAGYQRTSVFDRDDLPPGTVLNGPAIIEGPDTTYVVPPSWTLTVDSRRFFIIEQR